MLAVQLIKPTAAAAAELVRNVNGSDNNAGKYETDPNPISVNTLYSNTLECGKANHIVRPSAAVNCGTAKCQRRSRLRSELQPITSMPSSPAMNGIAPIQPTCTSLHPVMRLSSVGIQNQKI